MKEFFNNFCSNLAPILAFVLIWTLIDLYQSKKEIKALRKYIEDQEKV